MPSAALKELRVHMIDVSRLLESHAALTGSARGKKALSHLTRSGVVMLCACWEDYMESLLLEGFDYMANGVPDAQKLPISVRKHAALKIKESKNDLSPFRLADNSWKQEIRDYCKADIDKLHTPKSENLRKLYARYLGIADVTTMWKLTANYVDAFVTLRGSIAHKGRSAYVYPKDLQVYRDDFYENCLEMDRKICDYLHSLVGGNTQPWRKATK